jgi:predicted nucleic acid-binding protein
VVYLLDTDVVIDHLAEEPRIMALLNDLAPEGLFMSTVTLMEALEGVLEAPEPDARQRLEVLLRGVPLVPIDEAIARQAAEIRHYLRVRRKRVRTRALDIVIAATAVVRGYTLVTRNVKDFRDIPGLTLYEAS